MALHDGATALIRLERGRDLTEGEAREYLADRQTPLRHATASPAVEVADVFRSLLDAEREKVRRAAALLERQHRHEWRPDLVTCGVEQDALSILRGAIER